MSGTGLPPMSLEFQDMDAWVLEQDQRAAKAAAEKEEKEMENKKIRQAPPAKKVKTIVDVEAVASEQAAEEELKDENWIGKLLEYRQAHPVEGGGIKWAESTVTSSSTPRFNCTVLISEHTEPFGNNTVGFSTKPVTFSNKKSAKRFAAKKAIDWLIENEHMPSDGSVAFPKVAPAPQAPTIKSSAPSYASQVPGICQRLGFSPPQYSIEPIVPNGPLWDGYAHFGNDPRIEGKVGEVTNVYGFKNAKEELAKIVFSFMKDIERQRLTEHEDEEKKRQRSESSSPIASTKSAKV